jgi:hypothetical protein
MEPKVVEIVKKKSISELSYESKLVAERLRELAPDEFVSYADLSQLIGRDVQHHRTHICTAMKICLHENIVIKAVRNEGLKRLTDVSVIHVSEKFAGHVRRGARRVRREIISVDYDRLPRGEQIMHNARLSQIGALSFFSTEHNLKKIEKKVEEAQKQLPIGKTLDIFK